nr:MAG TPA: hypothetical protein [Caudoviricetes sp.]
MLSPPFFRFVRSYFHNIPIISNCQYIFSVFSKFYYLQNRNTMLLSHYKEVADNELDFWRKD